MKNGVFRGQCCDDVFVFFVCVRFTCASFCGSVSLFVSPAERKKKKTVLVIE